MQQRFNVSGQKSKFHRHVISIYRVRMKKQSDLVLNAIFEIILMFGFRVRTRRMKVGLHLFRVEICGVLAEEVKDSPKPRA